MILFNIMVKKLAYKCKLYLHHVHHEPKRLRIKKSADMNVFAIYLVNYCFGEEVFS